MSTKRFTLLLIVLVIGAASSLWAAGPAIGMITASGNLQVDHALVAGNGTLFDGSVIQTERASSRIQLNNGVQMRLSADSRATVFQRRLVLEAGQSELTAASGFEVEARSLHISPATADASARISLNSQRRVLVAAVRGTLRVSNASGMMVARIDAGDALDLEPQAAGATAATQASGCLLEKSGHLILVDRTTNIVLELQGMDLSVNVGNRVEVTGRATGGKPAVGDASQVISVAGVKVIARGGCTAVAKKIGASTAVVAAGGAAAGAAAAGGTAAAAAGTAAAAGAATAAGFTVGTVAVIGGVAAAATVGGLAAVGDLPGQSASAPPPTASR
jgi:hypothetical protein